MIPKLLLVAGHIASVVISLVRICGSDCRCLFAAHHLACSEYVMFTPAHGQSTRASP